MGRRRVHAHARITPTQRGFRSRCDSGTSDVGGFIPSLYDTLESQLCIDTTREFAAGESNGGIMTYQLGVDLAHRLAAIAPQFGSFHRGWNAAPSTGVPVLDLHGSADTTVPGNISLSGDGYYYTTTKEIFDGNAYSSGWKKANGCQGSTSHYVTPFDGTKKFWCVSEGACSGGDVIRCSWSGCAAASLPPPPSPPPNGRVHEGTLCNLTLHRPCLIETESWASGSAIVRYF